MSRIAIALLSLIIGAVSGALSLVVMYGIAWPLPNTPALPIDALLWFGGLYGLLAGYWIGFDFASLNRTAAVMSVPIIFWACVTFGGYVLLVISMFGGPAPMSWVVAFVRFGEILGAIGALVASIIVIDFAWEDQPLYFVSELARKQPH